ncbi:MAG: hypothetical protein J6R47_06405 [Acholeplasmatales bacterium]|nr:hypothetical protein [Acholeplasmatales bacterium]
MENDPLLFIDSVNDRKNTNSNQETYDSRVGIKKTLYKHRLDDIKAMLYYRINVLAEVTTRTGIVEGMVLEVKDEGLTLNNDGNQIVIPISSIKDINILKL